MYLEIYNRHVKILVCTYIIHVKLLISPWHYSYFLIKFLIKFIYNQTFQTSALKKKDIFFNYGWEYCMAIEINSKNLKIMVINFYHVSAIQGHLNTYFVCVAWEVLRKVCYFSCLSQFYIIIWTRRIIWSTHWNFSKISMYIRSVFMKASNVIDCVVSTPPSIESEGVVSKFPFVLLPDLEI